MSPKREMVLVISYHFLSPLIVGSAGIWEGRMVVIFFSPLGFDAMQSEWASIGILSAVTSHPTG